MREDFRSVDHFYAANPERDRSREVDYGVMWTDGGLNWPHYRVSWVESTGEFYAIRLGAGRGGPVEVLGSAEDREAAEAALEGWAEQETMRLSWVRSRLHRRDDEGFYPASTRRSDYETVERAIRELSSVWVRERLPESDVGLDLVADAGAALARLAAAAEVPHLAEMPVVTREV